MNAFILAGGALVIDAFLGDPRLSFHPTRLMGRLAGLLESWLRRGTDTRGLFLKGLLGWLLVAGVSAGAAWGTLAGGRAIGAGIGGALGGAQGAGTAAAVGWWAAAIVLVYLSIAPRDLAAHALRVRRAMAGGGPGRNGGGLEEGRRAVSMIVGRDVDRLDAQGVIRACVESVAESAVDGAAAPLFWAIALGPVGAVAYRAVNTLDSMWGHRDERYLWFGKTAARMDDAANWIPARLAFFAACLAAAILGLDARSALRLGWRDRRAHASPNSGWLEAAFAGALGIRLAGPAWYGGELTEKHWIGEARRDPEGADIDRSVRLMYATTLIFTAAMACAASIIPSG